MPTKPFAVTIAILFSVAALSGCGRRAAEVPNAEVLNTVPPVVSVVATQSELREDPSDGPTATLAAPSSSTAAEPATSSTALTAEDIAEGWIQLFDGKTLFGWTATGDTKWHVENGAIVATGSPVGSDEAKEQPNPNAGLLVTTTRFANYELRAEVQLEAGGNSGFFLQTPATPKNPAIECYELNVCDSHPAGFVTGSLVGRAKPVATTPAGDAWHSWNITVRGPAVQAKMDGELMIDFAGNGPNPVSAGLVGLQVNAGTVKFRKIALRPLTSKPLFTNVDLTGWRVVPGSESTFEVKEGAIQVTGGRGFLESDEAFDNFVLQFEVRTAAPNLNSGVFFRTQPGTAAEPSNGYEFQIHNGFKNGDRTQPIDFGTGGIFRRQPVRRVVSKDGEWTFCTLAADGPRFVTWVNGVMVVDWTDDRPADDNPRKGLRLAPGHFSLQGHDPTTDLRFRNLSVGTLPATP